MKVFLALLAAVSLGSCVSGPFYPQGPADLSKSAMFLTQTKQGTGILVQTNYLIGTIDGMNPGRAVRFPDGEKGIAMTPGEHLIGVAMFHSEPGTGLVTAEGTVSMKVEKGRIYEVMGSIVNPQRVTLWIRDHSTQKQVSKTISAEATDHGLPTPTIIVPVS